MVNDDVRRDSRVLVERKSPVALMNISPDLMNQLRYSEGNETRGINTSNDRSVDSNDLYRQIGRSWMMAAVWKNIRLLANRRSFFALIVVEMFIAGM